MNLSGSGVSMSVGPRGASVTFGSRGTYLNAGIPGTGLSSRSRIGAPYVPTREATSPQTGKFEANIVVADDGTIRFLDANGQPISQALIDKAKRQHGEAIRNLIKECCDKINAKVEELATIHLHTPAPNERLRYEPREFAVPPPKRPLPQSHGLLGWLLKSHRARIDEYNARRQAAYEKTVKEWQVTKATFETKERARKVLLEDRVLTDVGAMEEVLEGALKDISWPRETTVSAEVRRGGRLVMLDVDLPEIAEMPKTTASVPSRGYKLTVKEMNATKVQKLYMEHVHGIGFRLIGEAFAVLPSAEEVILSAFSQRQSKATGAVIDEYLYSVRVQRGDWSGIDFTRLQGLDATAALESFELKRDMIKMGLFRPILPIAAS